MSKISGSTVSYIVLIVLLVALMPWGASTAAAFAPRAMLAIVIAIVGHLVTRIGLALVPRQSPDQDRSPPVRGMLWGFSGGLWAQLRLSCAISLTIGVGSIALGLSHLLSPTAVFFLCLVAQQVTFVIFELIIAGRDSPTRRFGVKLLTVVAMAALALLFAWSSDITVLAQKPPMAAPISRAVSTIFAVPAVVVGILVLVFRYLAKGK
jgi:hypothetical protein